MSSKLPEGVEWNIVVLEESAVTSALRPSLGGQRSASRSVSCIEEVRVSRRGWVRES